MSKAALVKDRNGFWKIFEPVLEQNGFDVTLFDLKYNEDQKKLLAENWDAFIWRAKHNPKERNPAKRFISLMNDKGVKCYPDWKSFSYFDDKIVQSYLLIKENIPVPDTFVFYSEDEAIEFIENAGFPMIYKSAHGAGSSNVGMLKNKKHARKYIRKVFGKGVNTFFASDYQKDYVYLQEFAEGNEGDFRLVCFDNFVEGFFRNNRKDKPFASGSYDFDLKEIPVDLLEFVFNTNNKLGFEVMSYDIIKNRGEWVVTEISVVYGDLKDEIYNRSLQYYRSGEGKWIKHNPEKNHHVRVLESVIKRWNNDVD